MNDATLVADWNDAGTASKSAFERLLNSLPRPKVCATMNWQTLEQVTFGLFMGGLVILLVLLYSDILIV
jgi:hypothetical protein